MGKPILELDALAPEHEVVNIVTKDHPKGKLYELRNFDDLGVQDQQFIYSRASKFEELVRKTFLTPEEELELEFIVNKLTKIVLPDVPEALLEPFTEEELALPEEERPSKLKGMQKVKIIEAFTQASPEMQNRAAEATAMMTDQSTTVSSSPSASTSTPGTRNAG